MKMMGKRRLLEQHQIPHILQQGDGSPTATYLEAICEWVTLSQHKEAVGVSENLITCLPVLTTHCRSFWTLVILGMWVEYNSGFSSESIHLSPVYSTFPLGVGVLYSSQKPSVGFLAR